MNGVLLGLAAYVLSQLAIGLFVARGVRTEADYLIAGRRLGPAMAVLSIFATWFGAESCIGASGAIYANGLSGALADPFGYAACLLLMGLVFAAPLWRRQLSTLADLFRARFSPGVERLVVLLMVPSSVLWAAAQVRGFGQVVAASAPIDVDTAIALGAAVAIAYTAAGGLLADAVTDVIQGCVLIVGLLVLGVLAYSDIAALPVVPTPSLIPASSVRASVPTWSVAEAWVVAVLGSLWAQELGARVIACRSATIARNATVAAGLLYLTVGMVPVCLGLWGPSLLPGLTEHEQLLPLLAQRYLPGWAYVMFAGALISAILSTVDSALLSAASLTSHNLLAHVWPGSDDAIKLRLARSGVVVFGGVAFLLARTAEGVHELVMSASSFGSAGIFVAGAFALFSGFGGPNSATAALCVGAVTWGAGVLWSEWPAPYLTAVFAALVAYVVTGVVFQRGR